MSCRLELRAGVVGLCLLVGCGTVPKSPEGPDDPVRVGDIRVHGAGVLVRDAEPSADARSTGRASFLINESEVFGPPGEGLRRSKLSEQPPDGTYERLKGAIGP